jgi:Cu+-exporting ATPase
VHVVVNEKQHPVRATTSRKRDMNVSMSVTKDPVCGMTVDETTALRTERDGKTFYFCSDRCLQKFLSKSAEAKADDKNGGRCGEHPSVEGAIKSRQAHQ